MSGDLEIEGDLTAILGLGLRIRFDDFRLSALQRLRFLWLALRHRDTIGRSPKNIQYHYDRGNEFYQCYLDDSMTYSCAYFRDEGDSLDLAQRQKYDHVARKLCLQNGETLLDIGCGWGGMLIHAARHYGVTGRGVTLSRHQYEYARDKVLQLGLQDRVEILYQDYRHLEGSYDKVVSIGMFEHVGKKYIPGFFEKVGTLLKRGGLGLLHTIGKDSPSPTDAWTRRYIFPGGYLPSLDETVGAMGRNGNSILDVENLRLHYARTLRLWADNFEQNIDRIREMCDEAFIRRWRLFFASSAAGFEHGNIRLYQILFSNGLNNRLPVTREHWYRD